MDAKALQKRAQHLRELANLVTDERTRQAALRLAADCDNQADALERRDNNCVVSSAHSSSPVQSGPFVEIGDKHFMAPSLRILPGR